MPRIKEYISQRNVEGGFSTAEMSPEVAQMQGRAISQVGAGLTNIGDVIMKRDDIVQTSDADSKLAEMRARYTQRIKDESAGEKFDEAKIMQDYDSEVSKLAENYSSGRAQNFLRRASTDLKLSVQQSVAAASAERIAVKIKADDQQKRDMFSSTLMTDPTQRESILNQYGSFVDSLDTLNPAQKQIMKQQGSQEINIGAFRGRIRLEPNLMGLKEALQKGAFDSYGFSADDKKQLEGEISAMQSAREADLRRSQENQEKQKELYLEKVEDEFVQGIVKGTTSAADIATSPLKPNLKRTMISWMRSNKGEADKEMQEKTFSELFLRMQLEDGDPRRIYSEDQIIPYLDPANASRMNGSLSIEQFEKLRNELKGAKSQEGRFRNELYKNFLNQAKQDILSPDKVTGAVDAERYAVFNMFYDEFKKQYDEAKKQGIKDTEIFNKSNKSNLYDLILQYKKTSTEMMRSQYKRETTKNYEWVDQNGNVIDPTKLSADEAIRLKREGKIQKRKKAVEQK